MNGGVSDEAVGAADGGRALQTYDRATIGMFKLFSMIPDADAGRLYLEERRWQGLVHCPYRGCTDQIIARRGKRRGYYRCRACDGEFTVRTGTIFERSHVPLNKWVYATYLLAMFCRGLSSTQLSKMIGVTQKTAWLMLGRLREARGGEDGMTAVVADEMCIGAKELRKDADERGNQGRRAGNSDHQTAFKHCMAHEETTA